MNKNVNHLFKQEAYKFGLSLSDREINLFSLFYKELIFTNSMFNLTSITEEKDVIIKHFLDSLSCLSVIPKEWDIKDKYCIDIGTGAGFPAIPLLFCTEKLNYTFLEATKKKVEFIKLFLSKIEKKLYDRVNVVWARAEILAHNELYRQKYDICVSRGVANLAILCELCLPFIKSDGIFIAMKGPAYKDELNNAGHVIDIFGGEILEIKEILLPSEIKHYLVIIKKIKQTPDKYPGKKIVKCKF